MKLGVLAVFCAALFLVSQRATGTPLGYFVFFPIGFLTVFYFYNSRSWFFALLSGALLLAGYFFTAFKVFPQETVALFTVTLGSFGLLIYHKKALQGVVVQEEDHCEQIRAELVELREKHSTRVESLLHLEKQVASLINLFEIARDFNECIDLKETAQIIYKKVLPELNFERANLFVVTRGKNPPEISRIYTISKEGVEEKTLVEKDAVEREWFQKASPERGFISLGKVWLFPFVLEGEFNGLFSVEGAEKQDLAKFEVLSSQLGLQVRKVSLYEMVHELSIIDGLTGVFVRRHFLERFEEEIRRALKHGFPLSVLMLDIDHFKRYNDEFGHLVGDATLKEVAQIIRANVRNVDIVARYGGEEFAVVIPETHEAGAVEVAERIRSAVARRAFRVYDEETKVTVSVGISAFPQDLSRAVQGAYDPAHLFELLQKADRALYRGKEEGRNRVVVHRSLGFH